MKNRWWLLSSIIIILLVFTACSNSESVKAQGSEGEAVHNYGFGDTSYENLSVEGVKSHNIIQLNRYGDTEDSIKKTYDLIINYLKESNLIDDDYVTIFDLSESESKDTYLVIKSVFEENEHGSILYVLEGDGSSGEFDITNLEDIDGQINESKVALFTVDDHLLISTEAPSSAYIENFYFQRIKSLLFLKRESFDLMGDYLERKISLLEIGAVETALALEPVHLYPFTYEEMINTSNNLALKKIYPLAKELSDNGDYKKAKAYLDDEMWTYVDRIMIGADTIHEFIDKQVDAQYALDKKEVTEIFELYHYLLDKTGDVENIEWIKEYVDQLNE